MAKSKVDDFLAKAKPPKAGGACKTCVHPKREAIEADAKLFNQRREEGSKVTWEFFVDEHIKPEHDYPYNFRSLIRHMEACCGLEVA